MQEGAISDTPITDKAAHGFVEQHGRDIWDSECVDAELARLLERDVKIVNRTVKIVTTAKPHKCSNPTNGGKLHSIKAGTRARFEHALVDGEWGSYYVCLKCMNEWIKEFGA
jgi:hypothetical protein